ncbi:CAP-Gly domain-containing linker protein 1-like [Pleuronectes platessa]|uniref:CAP-Gly domain-containing linker protein 1-like n=1 Tax=Pleuronectes platessa TaxID=8262 RepID=UPI00232A46B3|nr:CAP-Gly domain-containing linker protein 1-like [Pleuronectes platessa]
MEKPSDKLHSKQSSAKYAIWKRDKIESKHDELNDWWKERDNDKAKVIDTLEGEIEDLQKKLEDGRRREEDLEKSLKESQNEIQKSEQDKAELSVSLYQKSLKHEVTRQMLADTHTQYGAALAEVERRRDSVVAQMQRTMDECRTMAIQTQNAFTDMKNQAKRLEHVVLNLKNELVQMEEGKKRVVENFKDELSQKDKVIENEKQRRKTDKKEAVLDKSEQDKIITEQGERITDLEKEKESLNLLLISTCKKCSVLSNKVEEVEVVKEGMRAVGFEMAAVQETNFLLKSGVNAMRRKIKRLEEERRTEKYQFKEMQEKLTETKQQNVTLTENKRLLISKLKMSEKELNKKQEETRILGTRMLRLNADVESCAQVIHDPRKVKIGVQKMKEQCPSYDKVRVGEETKEDYQLRLYFLNKKLHLSETRHESSIKEGKRLQHQLTEAQDHVHMLRDHFIGLLKEKKLEVENLNKELKNKAKRPPVTKRSPNLPSQAQMQQTSA